MQNHYPNFSSLEGSIDPSANNNQNWKKLAFKRGTPRQLLQLYNNCWLHMELCAEIFSSPKQITSACLDCSQSNTICDLL